jgi:hypothetical protein
MVKYCNCKNVKDKKYTGEEATPLGLGYHASGYSDGKRKKGKNNEWYVVKEDKNKRKRWQKHTIRGSEQGLYPPKSK